MININLLPYRQAQKRLAQKQLIIAGVCVVVLAIFIVFGSYWSIDSKTKAQRAHNQEIELAIVTLNVKSNTFKNIQEQKKAIIERLNLIETLQAKRHQASHLLAHWPVKLPDGIHFDLIKRENGRVLFKGYAENHRQVSILMRQLERLPMYTHIGLAQVNTSHEKNNEGLKQFFITADLVLPQMNKGGNR